jgi:hypothetical protein
MGNVSRWRDSGHLQRAVETAGGQLAFESAVAAMLDDARLAARRDAQAPAVPGGRASSDRGADPAHGDRTRVTLPGRATRALAHRLGCLCVEA